VAVRLAIVPELIFDLRRRLQPLSLRVGLGIGKINGRLLPPVNKLGGEAFQFARRAIEDVKQGASHKYPVLTAFRSGNEAFNRVANLIYGLHDTLLGEMSARQWKTINAFLTHQKRAPQAARALSVGVSTVSRTLRRGHFWQIVETIEGMSEIIERSF
jgi:hypothetical protein